MSLLGHVAQVGEVAEVRGVRFEVLALDGLAIDSALVYLPESAEEKSSTEESTGNAEHKESPNPPGDKATDDETTQSGDH